MGGGGVEVSWAVVFNRGEAVSAPAVQDASWLSYSCRTVTLRGGGGGGGGGEGGEYGGGGEVAKLCLLLLSRTHHG